jgi:hypothetical protein
MAEERVDNLFVRWQKDMPESRKNQRLIDAIVGISSKKILKVDRVEDDANGQYGWSIDYVAPVPAARAIGRDGE